MNWSIKLINSAEGDLKNLDSQVKKRIINKLEWLGKNFDNITPLALTGEYQGFYKFRVGDWRILYKIDWDKNILAVCYINKRDKAYK